MKSTLLLLLLSSQLFSQNLILTGRVVPTGKNSVTTKSAVVQFANGVICVCDKKGRFSYELPAGTEANSLLAVSKITAEGQPAKVVNGRDAGYVLLNVASLVQPLDIYVMAEADFAEREKAVNMAAAGHFADHVAEQLGSLLTKQKRTAEEERFVSAATDFIPYIKTLTGNIASNLGERMTKQGQAALADFIERKDLAAAQKRLVGSANFHEKRLLAQLYTLDLDLTKATDLYLELVKSQPDNVGLLTEFKEMAIWSDAYQQMAAVLFPAVEKIKDADFLLSAFNDIASYFNKKNEYANAIAYMERALALQKAKEAKDPDREGRITFALLLNFLQAQKGAGEKAKALATVDSIVARYAASQSLRDDKDVPFIFAVANHFGGEIVADRDGARQAFPYFQRLFGILEGSPDVAVRYPHGLLFMDKVNFCTGMEETGGAAAECEACYEEAVRFADFGGQGSDHQSLGKALVYLELAQGLSGKGEGRRAVHFYEKTIDALALNGTPVGRTARLDAIGCAAALLGDYGLKKEARAMVFDIKQNGTVENTAPEDRVAMAKVWFNIGQFHKKFNEADSAAMAFKRTIDLVEASQKMAVEDSALVANCHNQLGAIAIESRDDAPLGIAHFTKAHAIDEQLARKNPKKYTIETAICAHNMLTTWAADLENCDRGKALDLIRQTQKLLAALPAGLAEKEEYLNYMSSFELEFSGHADEFRQKLFEVQRLDKQRKAINGNFGKSALAKQMTGLLEKLVETAPANSKARFRQLYVNELGNAAWYAIFDRQFALAEQAARKALELDPSQIWINTNLAHALILQGKKQEGMTVYEKWKGTLHQDGKLMRTIFLEDIEELERAGITHPDFREVVEAIGK